MGRPKGDQKTAIHPRIPLALDDRLSAHIGIKHGAKSAFVERAITEKLDRAEVEQGGRA
jgi:hypothetical protein